jgi:hypothetical protein
MKRRVVAVALAASTFLAFAAPMASATKIDCKTPDKQVHCKIKL